MGRDLLVGATAVILGQLLLLAIEPLSRAASDGIERSGIALLSPDSLTYLELAAESSWSETTPWNRFLLIALLRFGATFGDAASFLVVVQACALILASALAHRTAARLGGMPAGLIATVVVAVNPLTAQWVRFVLSETLFFSLMLIALSAGVALLRGAARLTTIPVLLTTALLATFLRPNGVLVLGSALTLVVVTSVGRRALATLLIVVVWSSIGVGLALGLDAAGQPAERTITAQLHGGVVVEGTDDVVVTIAMPPPDDPDDIANAAGIRYALGEPVAVARLAVTRIATEVVQVRRHYPTPINIVIAGAMAVLVVTTIAGARTTGASALVRCSAILGAPILLLVGATFATPEGRYGWGALILSAPLAGIGAARILRAARARLIARATRADQSPEGPSTAR